MDNGGYFVLSKEIFKYLELNQDCVFENEPMENLSKDGQLMAYKHDGFWQCMDTKRDHEYLENLEAKRGVFYKMINDVEIIQLNRICDERGRICIY